MEIHVILWENFVSFLFIQTLKYQKKDFFQHVDWNVRYSSVNSNFLYIFSVQSYNRVKNTFYTFQNIFQFNTNFKILITIFKNFYAYSEIKSLLIDMLINILRKFTNLNKQEKYLFFLWNNIGFFFFHH